ncbi:hydrolase [Marinilabilia rubra]|uniref:Uncharacterized protein n=1 Tax=Marinilabilia rubra TaxID=2162893 RepID=A0A2U2B3T0_9BACT|nr:hydrolase [Marinilabilia rubra]PWD97718.1 hypothetical protein DDZ16_19385 [Marinilabilia rubra]
MQSEKCCPKFDPAPWQEKRFDWHDKLFVKDHVFTLFYMPITFGRTVKRMLKKLEASDATCQDNMILSDHTSKWNMDLYMAVDKPLKDAENVTFNGHMLSKVYEGPYKDTGKWCNDFETFAGEHKLNINQWFMWYTTCPKCAKKYGKNYVAILGKTNYLL